MAKITKSVRMSETSLEKITELRDLLKEGMPDIIDRAISYLYEHRKDVYEQDVEARRIRLEGIKNKEL